MTTIAKRPEAAMRYRRFSRSCRIALLATVGSLSGSMAQAHDTREGEAYPTAVIADYVLACMSANGNSYEALHQCSCSIDYIRERLSYADYERAEAVMQAQLDRGQRGIFYRDAQQPQAMVERLQAIQAESTLRCF